MIDVSPQEHLAFADEALREIRKVLATAPPCPKTRELRARASTFERAMMTFAGRVPTKEQTSALLEGVRELHARVVEAAQIQRSQSTTTPVVRVVAVTNPRVVLPAARPSQRPTVKPPPVASRPPGARSILPITLPPPSSSGRR